MSSLEEARAFLGTAAWIADCTLHLLGTVRMLRQEPNAVESGWTYYFERLGPPLFNVDAVRLNADA